MGSLLRLITVLKRQEDARLLITQSKCAAQATQETSRPIGMPLLMDYGRLVMSRQCQDSAGREVPTRREEAERELARVSFFFSLPPPASDSVGDRLWRKRRRRRRSKTRTKRGRRWKTKRRKMKNWRSIKEEQPATVLLDLTRLFVWLHYYYCIYWIDTKGEQSGRLLPTHPSLQPKLAGRGSNTM